ncbi:MAG: hypothetical protein ACXAB7_08915 [Candidatus Kariarchaeaceae archaeon]|jgi:hypothetical protein
MRKYRYICFFILLALLILSASSANAELITYKTSNKNGLLGSTYFLSLGLENGMVKGELYQASVLLTLLSFASNVHQISEIALWILISDTSGNEILKIEADEKGTIVSEGFAWATSIKYWTTNFPDQVTFAIGATFFEVDTGGGSNSNTVNFINLHTYSFKSENTTPQGGNADQANDSSFPIPLQPFAVSLLLLVIFRNHRTFKTS